MIHTQSDAPGAHYLGENRTRFRVWAPLGERVDIVLAPEERSERVVRLEAHSDGTHEAIAADVPPGTRYVVRLDGETRRPDPASRHQPDGVHGASSVMDPHFPWTDAAFRAPNLEDLVIYELHIGTFTPAGTFDAAIARLGDLRDLGVNCVELMPVAQFPGERNWGYDGVLLYAAQNSYGGPDGFRRFVDAAHALGIAVCLDVVYNHLGPEGNYLRDFGPYFTDRYATPWGEAINFEGEGSDGVRSYFVQNALFWTGEMHVDALRLDAIHAIADNSALTFVEELTASVHRMAERDGRRVLMIAENNSNDSRLVTPLAAGGRGCDAQWNDDFHHALRSVLTGERDGYYSSFGDIAHLARALENGYVYSGEHSTFHERRHGSSTETLAPSAFVVFAQNHDQVGNRMLGERLDATIGPDPRRLASAAVLLSPYVPMLFMGEEYGETAPFLYFVSHGDPDLVEAVRRGRRDEFASFDWTGEPPDPQATETFERSRLDHMLRAEEPHATIRAYHRDLIELRHTLGLGRTDGVKPSVEWDESTRFIAARWRAACGDVVLCLNCSDEALERDTRTQRSSLARVFDSANARYGGPGAMTPERLPAFEDKPTVSLRLAPWTAALYAQRPESL